MKFLVDANLPYKLAISLKNRGYDAVHTDDLPNKDFAKLLEKYFDTIVKLFDFYNVIEMNNEQIIGHEK